MYIYILIKINRPYVFLSRIIVIHSLTSITGREIILIYWEQNIIICIHRHFFLDKDEELCWILCSKEQINPEYSALPIWSGFYGPLYGMVGFGLYPFVDFRYWSESGHKRTFVSDGMKLLALEWNSIRYLDFHFRQIQTIAIWIKNLYRYWDLRNSWENCTESRKML